MRWSAIGLTLLAGCGGLDLGEGLSIGDGGGGLGDAEPVGQRTSVQSTVVVPEAGAVYDPAVVADPHGVFAVTSTSRATGSRSRPSTAWVR